MVEHRETGVYNATGPDYRLGMGRLLDACREVSGNDAEFVWLDDRFLLDQVVGPWTELPLWIPEDETTGSLAHDCRKAMHAGLTLLPLATTGRDPRAWHRSLPADSN